MPTTAASYCLFVDWNSLVNFYAHWNILYSKRVAANRESEPYAEVILKNPIFNKKIKLFPTFAILHWKHLWIKKTVEIAPPARKYPTQEGRTKAWNYKSELVLCRAVKAHLDIIHWAGFGFMVFELFLQLGQEIQKNVRIINLKQIGVGKLAVSA